MGFAVAIVNPEFVAYYAGEVARRAALDIATITQLGLQTAQLTAFYNAADNAIDARDDKIDAQIAFMDTLENLKLTQDLPMVECKKDVLEQLELPELAACGSGIVVHTPLVSDGRSIDSKSLQFLNETCGNIPIGWTVNNGLMHGYRTATYNSSIVSNADRRRVERFRKRKTDLVRQAQIGIKSVYNAGDTLSKYAQAAAIHSGLADLYIQGFNSAGAGLGVLLGRLADSGGNITTNATVGSLGGSATGSQGGGLP